jgi:hypothetical protein
MCDDWSLLSQARIDEPGRVHRRAARCRTGSGFPSPPRSLERSLTATPPVSSSNIWYLGEAVRNYENGELVDRAGSFEAGVDGAQAGVAMPADPVPGLSYRQEYYKGQAEDKAAIVTVGQERVEVPFGYC